MDVLTLEHVSKAFGRSTVLDDLSFRVPQNCVYGFIGENGAGKTTTMKLILGLLRPDKGADPGGGRTCLLWRRPYWPHRLVQSAQPDRSGGSA